MTSNGCKVLSLVFLVGLMVLSGATHSHAYDFGTNITIYDGISTSETGWNGKAEDGEVEPGMTRDQIWDLEAFYLKGSLLSLVGGYDFKHGVDRLYSGDIFIDIDGDAQYGVSNDKTGYNNGVVTNSFGYDYAITLNFGEGLYNVYELNDSSTTTVYYSQNQESNPWRYNSGGDLYATGSFIYLTELADFDGLRGGNHNVISGLDLAFLGTDINNFIVHYTMQCGNDNIMGQHVAPVPEPATLFLLGSGLIGVAGLRGKRRKK